MRDEACFHHHGLVPMIIWTEAERKAIEVRQMDGSPYPTPAQIRKYRRLRGVLLTCIVGAFVSLVATAWLFFRSGSNPTGRAIAVAVFIELAVSAAVIGAFAPCPVCRARIGSEPGRLLPSLCGTCGAQFEEGPEPS
jgi:hypothetical protein